MNNVIPMFAFNDSQLRCTIIDGQPWFVAVDACRILGLSTYAGVSIHTQRLDADEKMTVRKGGQVKTLDPATLAVFGKNDSVLSLISRPGLFALIGRSSKPEAKQFDRWVRHEVLPQIMDNGGYMAADANVEDVVEAAPANKLRSDLDLLSQMTSVVEAARARIAELELAEAAAAPKVSFVDNYVASNGTMSFADAARTSPCASW